MSDGSSTDLVNNESIQVQLERVSTGWHNLSTACRRTVDMALVVIEKQGSEAARDYAGRIRKARAVFEERLDELDTAAHAPELILAVAGTTSAGKSALVNLLIGAEILPTAVEEMSAGVAMIRHGAHRRLVIPETGGATWQTGIWEDEADLTPDAIRERLDTTMKKYRALEDAGQQPEPVRFEIDWPTRLGKQAADYGLPKGVRLTLLDLPGRKSIDDTRNVPVINQYVQKAFCIIAFNAAETDHEKQEQLLTQVADQISAVRDIGAAGGHEGMAAARGVLARMMFVLNRIDVFTANGKKSAASANTFADEMTTRLRRVLRDRLHVDRSAVEQIRPQKLSALPALNALEIRKDASPAAFKVLKRRFLDMLNEADSEWVEDLPRLPETWDEADRKRVVDAWLEASHLGTFKRALAANIQENLPELILGPVAQHIAIAAGQMVSITAQGLLSVETRTREETQALLEHLASLDTDMRQLATDAKKKLDAVTLGEEGRPLVLDDLGQWGRALFRQVGIEREQDPLFNFGGDVLGAADQIVYYCIDIIQNGNSESTYEPNGISAEDKENIHAALHTLCATSYGKTWDREFFVPDVVELPPSIDQALKQVFAVVMPLYGKLLSDKAQKWGNCSRLSLDECASKLLADIKQKSQAPLNEKFTKFSALGAVFDEPIIIDSFTPPRELEYEVHPESARREQEVLEKYFEKEGIWWTFGLFSRNVEKQRHVKQEVIGLRLPPFPSLLENALRDGWAWKLIMNQAVNFVENFQRDFNQQINARISEGVREFRAAIVERQDEATAQNEQFNQLWAEAQNGIDLVTQRLRAPEANWKVMASQAPALISA